MEDKRIDGIGITYKELPIRGFTGKWRFLSNFYEDETYYWDYQTFKSAEHAYQWAKTDDPIWQRKIILAPTPGKAKRLGNKCLKRPEWEYIKTWTMLKILRRKFSRYSVLASMLLDTGDKKLVEENKHGDKFWGTVSGEGENYLGKLLMIVRDELKRQWEYDMGVRK